MRLDANTIHVWSADQSGFALQPLLAECRHWLQAEDASRLQRLRIERHQLQLLLGRYLLRSVLSRYHPETAPADWLFVKNAHGKPALDPARHGLPLFFNLSHSRGRLVMAVAQHELLGVDIEDCTRARRIVRIASRYFSPQEVSDLLALPAAQQTGRFYQLWTLKEAYIKARGLGLAMPLQQFSFAFAANGDIAVTFAKQLGDIPQCWQFWQTDVGTSHKLALAIKREEPHPRMAVQMHEFPRGQVRASAANQ